MSDLLIKNVPDGLRKRLMQSSKRNHRSMSREALALIERGLMGSGHSIASLEKPFRWPFELT